MQEENPINALLCGLKLLLSVPYQLGHLVHQSFYSCGLLTAHKLPVPVISVGNISFGGSGKTPFTIALAEHLSNQGLKVGILTRGYKSRACNSGRVVIASPADIGEHSPEEIGDEPYLMLEKLGQAKNPNNNSIIIAKNRFRGAMHALTLASYDVFILDDGMQHLALKRDVEIALVNVHETGFMREFPWALKRADFVIYTKVEGDFDKPHLRYKLSLLGELDPSRAICLVTAIADPQSLVKQLASHLNDLAETNPVNSAVYSSSSIQLRSFPDHHYFSTSEVNKLKSTGMNLLCTLKDFVKIPKTDREAFIPIDLELVVHPSDLFTRITGKIKNGK